MSNSDEPMKAITVRHPWAELIARGVKTIENRGRQTHYRGLIAIHAAKSAYGDQELERICLQQRVRKAWAQPALDGLRFGAVIAVADLIDCHPAARPDTGPTCCAPWGDLDYPAPGAGPAWHLVLGNIRRLAEPVPASGQQGVPWNLHKWLARRVRAQIAEAVVSGE